jgi:chromate transporter
VLASPARAGTVGLAFVLFGVLHLALPVVIGIATPLSVLLAWRFRA